MTVRVTLVCQLKPNTLDTLTPFLAENLPNVRAFAGNKRVSVLFNQDNNEMLLDEDWEDVKSHQSYLEHIAQTGILAQLSGFLASPPDIKYFTPSAL